MFLHGISAGHYAPFVVAAPSLPAPPLPPTMLSSSPSRTKPYTKQTVIRSTGSGDAPRHGKCADRKARPQSSSPQRRHRASAAELGPSWPFPPAPAPSPTATSLHAPAYKCAQLVSAPVIVPRRDYPDTRATTGEAYYSPLPPPAPMILRTILRATSLMPSSDAATTMHVLEDTTCQPGYTKFQMQNASRWQSRSPREIPKKARRRHRQPRSSNASSPRPALIQSPCFSPSRSPAVSSRRSPEPTSPQSPRTPRSPLRSPDVSSQILETMQAQPRPHSPVPQWHSSEMEGSVEEGPATWVHGVRALRDAHVRLVQRQLRHLRRLNAAVDAAAAAPASAPPSARACY